MVRAEVSSFICICIRANLRVCQGAAKRNRSKCSVLAPRSSLSRAVYMDTFPSERLVRAFQRSCASVAFSQFAANPSDVERAPRAFQATRARATRMSIAQGRPIGLGQQFQVPWRSRVVRAAFRAKSPFMFDSAQVQSYQPKPQLRNFCV